MSKHYVQGDNVWLPAGQMFSPALEASLDTASGLHAEVLCIQITFLASVRAELKGIK